MYLRTWLKQCLLGLNGKIAFYVFILKNNYFYTLKLQEKNCGKLKKKFVFQKQK